MNSAYVYLQLYKLFDKRTPLNIDCGKLCNSACCKNDDCGMYLFPGESNVYKLLNPDWISIETSDFTYKHENKTYHLPIAFCKGKCDRYQRPLSCRIFPLTPILNESNKLEIIIDPRAKSICPLSTSLDLNKFDQSFVKNVKKTFNLLIQSKQFYSFLKEYSIYINEFRRFF